MQAIQQQQQQMKAANHIVATQLHFALALVIFEFPVRNDQDARGGSSTKLGQTSRDGGSSA